jgi:hypothetical protein
VPRHPPAASSVTATAFSPAARRARRYVFDSLAGHIHQSLLHRPGKGERRFVVRHDRRAGVRADADAGRQAERQRYRHGQIPLTHWRAIDELDERQPRPQAVRIFAPSTGGLSCLAAKAHRTDARQLATDSAIVFRDDAVVAVFDPCRKKALAIPDHYISGLPNPINPCRDLQA